jgi:hypothetical protein
LLSDEFRDQGGISIDFGNLDYVDPNLSIGTEFFE